MAQATGISLRSVQRIWEPIAAAAPAAQPSSAPTIQAFAEKVEDIVGLYMDPPMHTVVLSIDEKSQIQALDRTQPGLPLKPGKCGTMTHDYKRNGVTTLFAALNVRTAPCWAAACRSTGTRSSSASSTPSSAPCRRAS
jgi:hypothetical protein